MALYLYFPYRTVFWPVFGLFEPLCPTIATGSIVHATLISLLESAFAVTPRETVSSRFLFLGLFCRPNFLSTLFLAKRFAKLVESGDYRF